MTAPTRLPVLMLWPRLPWYFSQVHAHVFTLTVSFLPGTQTVFFYQISVYYTWKHVESGSMQKKQKFPVILIFSINSNSEYKMMTTVNCGRFVTLLLRIYEPVNWTDRKSILLWLWCCYNSYCASESAHCLPPRCGFAANHARVVKARSIQSVDATMLPVMSSGGRWSPTVASKSRGVLSVEIEISNVADRKSRATMEAGIVSSHRRATGPPPPPPPPAGPQYSHRHRNLGSLGRPTALDSRSMNVHVTAIVFMTAVWRQCLDLTMHQSSSVYGTVYTKNGITGKRSRFSRSFFGSLGYKSMTQS